jgi:hypothetical protein
LGLQAEEDVNFSGLTNGEYALTVTGPGFRGAERRDVVLTAAEYKSIGEIKLEVGSVDDTVTVTAQTEQVQNASVVPV